MVLVLSSNQLQHSPLSNVQEFKVVLLFLEGEGPSCFVKSHGENTHVKNVSRFNRRHGYASREGHENACLDNNMVVCFQFNA